MLVAGLLLSSFGHAEEGRIAPENDQRWEVSVGMGGRDLPFLVKGIEGYIQERAGESVDLGDVLDDETLHVPYFRANVAYTFQHWHPLFSRAQVQWTASFDWTSSSVFGEDYGSETVPIAWEGIDVGDATAEWSHYLNTYYAAGLGFRYSPLFLSLGFVTFLPYGEVSGGFSNVNNSSEVDFSVEDVPLLEFLDDETEKELGIYTESNTDALLTGLGYYGAATIGIEVHAGRWSLHAAAGYREERNPLFVRERTTLGDEEKTTTEMRLPLNTSGMEYSAMLGYSFSVGKVTVRSVVPGPLLSGIEQIVSWDGARERAPQ